jgi:hypothetical protein
MRKGLYWNLKKKDVKITQNKKFRLGSRSSVATIEVPTCVCMYKNSARTSHENTLRLHYKAQPVNAVKGNSRCLLWEPYGTHKYTLVYKNSVRTSQETHYVSATKPNRLLLFRETVAGYCENRTEHTNTLQTNIRDFSLCLTGNILRFRYNAQLVHAAWGTVAVYCENHTEHVNTLCGQNAELLDVNVCGIGA